MDNILTIDFEDWFQADLVKARLGIEKWDSLKDRLLDNSSMILEILERAHVKATFFVVTYNAKRYPGLIRTIAQAGHELAVHTCFHDSVTNLTPAELSKDIEYSKKFVEDVSQTRVIGFRAPNWSITPFCAWALDIIRDCGFLYDSSMRFSVFKQMRATMPQGLLEVPRSEFSFFALSLPFGGGFFLRAYPYTLTKTIISMYNKKNVRTMTYVHPWEFEKTPAGFKPGFIAGLFQDFLAGTTKEKFALLLKDFKFSSIRDIFFGKERLNEEDSVAESARR